MDSTNDELTLSAIAAILYRRRGLVLRVIAAFMLAALIYVTFTARSYEASGTIEIQQNSPDALDLKNLNGSSAAAGDALQANIDLQTQANILGSGSLALATIHALHLENSPEFKGKQLLGKNEAQDTLNAVDINHLLKVFGNNLKVSPVGGTRLITIDYQSKDPNTAANVVNTLMKGLIDYTFETQLTATAQTSKWLGGQLTELRKQSEQLQAKVVDLQRQTGVYTLGATDAQGHEQAYSGILEQLQQSDLALQQAEQNRILKGAIAAAVQEGGPQAISSLAGNTPGQMNIMSVLQTLREQEATQQAALVEAESKFGSAYPSVVELRANISGIQRAISQEEERIRGRARSDYQIAQQAEANTRAHSDAIHRQASGLNDKSVEFAIVKQEADQSRELYEDLLKRLKEAAVLEGLRSSNILIVDRARIPTKAKAPNKLLILGVALGSGLVLGCFAAALIDVLDDRIHTIDDVRRCSGDMDVVGVPSPDVGELQDRPTPTATRVSHGGFLEAVRRMQLVLDVTADRGRVLVVTSAAPDEGVRIFGATLATVLAQSGLRVLLVNGLNGGTNARGISSGEDAASHEVAPEPQIGSSELHPNVAAAEFSDPYSFSQALLSGVAFDNCLAAWQERYACVLLLTKAAPLSADAVLAGRMAQHTFLLTCQETTRTSEIRIAAELLNRTKTTRSLSAVFLADPGPNVLQRSVH